MLGGQMRGEIKTFTEIREKVNLQFITNIQLRLNSLIFYSNVKINSVLNTKEGFEKETKTIDILGSIKYYYLSFKNTLTKGKMMVLKGWPTIYISSIIYTI